MYKLIIQDDEGKTTVVPLIRDELTIGRQEGNTIRLTERNVSRRHAKLLRAHEEIVIEDLDSYNGVRVNGSRIQGRAEIKEADRVQIGDYLIEVKADAPNSDAETREFAVIADNDAPAAIAADADKTAPAAAPIAADAPTAQVTPSNGVAPNLTPAATAAITAPAEHSNARLVILSSIMAGREFELDKPAMVIGRTEENDIWVNHRSISRHHAKVVRENGSYAIVDLQSANGVRVNGEEYGKVELRTRDVVDLGHVRFRFVAPGEDFLFGRDAQAVDIATESGPSKVLWFVVGMLVLGVVAFLAVGSGNENTKTAEQPKVESPVVTPPPTQIVPEDAAPVAPELVPAVAIDATVAVARPPTEDKLAALLEKAVEARKSDQWPVMAEAAKEALSLDPTSTQAKDLAEQAAFETANSKQYEAFQEALGERKWAQVASSFAEIDPASVYKIKGQADHDRLRSEFKRFQVQVAEKAARRNKCSEIQKMKEAVPPQWSVVSTAIGRVRCREASSRPTNNSNNNSNKNPPPPPPPPPPGPSYEQLMEQATAAIKSTHYGKGGKLCEQALQKVPGDQTATMTCVIAACNLKKGALAKKYLRRLKSASRRAGVKQICIRLGVPGFSSED